MTRETDCLAQSLRVDGALTRPALELSELAYVPGSKQDVASGLLGWVSFVLNGAIRVDGCAVRRTRSGRMTISYPARKASDGTRHAVLQPADAESKAGLERTILGAIGLGTWAGRAYDADTPALDFRPR